MTKISERRLSIINLRDISTDDLIKLYARVFAGSPWYEVLKCKKCEVAYSNQDNLTEISLRGTCSKNPECGEKLELIPFYTGEDDLAKRIIADAVERSGFIGMGCHLDDALVGFTWGFSIKQNENSPSVRFIDINKRMSEAGYNPETIFYGAEIGVDPEYQGKGIGAFMARHRLSEAKNKYLCVAIRTKNVITINLYNKLFGQENMKKLFPDPDPAKGGVYWYVCNLDFLNI